LAEGWYSAPRVIDLITQAWRLENEAKPSELACGGGQDLVEECLDRTLRGTLRRIARVRTFAEFVDLIPVGKDSRIIPVDAHASGATG